MDKQEMTQTKRAPNVQNRPANTFEPHVESSSFPVLREEGKEASYSRTLQGKPINALMSSSAKLLEENAITHVQSTKSDDVLISLDANSLSALSPQTLKILIVALTIATRQLPHKESITAEAVNKGRLIQIPLSAYMDACKIKDRKEARAQLNAAIRDIYKISLEFDEVVYRKPEGKSRKVKTTEHHSMRITDHNILGDDNSPVKNNVARFKLSFDIAEYLADSYIMPYPDALLTINTRYHPHSIPLGWKLCTLHNLNFGKPNANVTTVKTLLNAAKNIPTYKSISGRGNIYDKIIEPFDRDLAALVEAGVLASYSYASPHGYFIDGGRYIDGKYVESGKLGTLSYPEFEELSVCYELRDYPDQTPRIEEKNRRIQKAIRRNKNAAKKKEQQQQDSQDRQDSMEDGYVAQE